MRIILFLISWLTGWIYYKRLKFLGKNKANLRDYKISVIIPARDEEKNL